MLFFMKRITLSEGFDVGETKRRHCQCNDVWSVCWQNLRTQSATWTA